MLYQKLRTIMKEKGISIYRLCIETGLNQSTLYNGFRYGTLFPAYRKKICDVLNMEESELFTPEERGERNGRK